MYRTAMGPGAGIVARVSSSSLRFNQYRAYGTQDILASMRGAGTTVGDKFTKFIRTGNEGPRCTDYQVM